MFILSVFDVHFFSSSAQKQLIRFYGLSPPLLQMPGIQFDTGLSLLYIPLQHPGL